MNWALTDQLMVSTANFAVGLLLARILGVAEFGRFSLAWLVIIYAGSVQRGSIIAPMQTLVAEKADGAKNSFFSDLLLLNFGISTLTAVLVFAGCKGTEHLLGIPDSASLALPIAVLVFTGQTQEFYRRYLFVREKSSAAFLYDAARYGGTVAIILVSHLSSGVGMDAMRALWLTSAACTISIALGFLERAIREVKPQWSGSGSASHYRFAKWMLPSAILAWCSENLFIFSAGAILGPSAAGVLRASQNLVGGLAQIFFQGLENRVPARAAERHQDGGIAEMQLYLRKTGIAGLMVTVVVSSLVLISPDDVLEFFYGQDYTGFGYLLYYMALAQVFIAIQVPLNVGLRSVGKTRSIFWASFWRALVSIGASYPLVRFAGLAGAALGFVLINVIVTAVLANGVRPPRRHGSSAELSRDPLRRV